MSGWGWAEVAGRTLSWIIVKPLCVPQCLSVGAASRANAGGVAGDGGGARRSRFAESEVERIYAGIRR